MDFNRWIASLPSRDPAVLIAAADSLAPADRGTLRTWLGKRATQLSTGGRTSASSPSRFDAQGSDLYVQDHEADDDYYQKQPEEHVRNGMIIQPSPKMQMRTFPSAAGLSNTGYGPLLPWYGRGAPRIRSHSEAAHRRNHFSDMDFSSYAVNPHRGAEIQQLQQCMEYGRRSGDLDEDLEYQIQERWSPSAGPYSEFMGNHLARVSHQQEIMRTTRSRSEAAHRAAAERVLLGYSRPWPLQSSQGSGSRGRISRGGTPEVTTLDPPFGAKRVPPSSSGAMWRTFG